MWGRKEHAPKIRSSLISRKNVIIHLIVWWVFLLWDVSMIAIKILQHEPNPRIYNSECSCMPTSHHWETLPICSLVFVKPSTLGSHLFSLYFFFPHNKYFVSREIKQQTDTADQHDETMWHPPQSPGLDSSLWDCAYRQNNTGPLGRQVQRAPPYYSPSALCEP